MARSRADAANTYDQLLHPFDGWTFGAYAHEAGQFGIGEAKGAVNMVAGAIVDTSPALMLADGMTGSRLSHPIVSVGESQEDGEATFPWVVAAATGVEALAAAPEAAQGLAGAGSRAAVKGFHSAGDPLADVLGPAHTSHSEEYEATLKAIEKQGGEVVFRGGQNGYTPGLSPGKAGQVILDPDSSIGAVRHEYQHFLDDEAAGRPGYNSYFDENSSPMARWKFEIRAYKIELKLAKQLGLKGARRRLIGNARAEKRAIFGR